MIMVCPMQKRIYGFLQTMCVVAFSFVFVGTVAKAEDEGSLEVDYGDMYVVQKRPGISKKFELGAGYSYGFSNPYLHVHGAQVSGSYRLSEFFSVGVAPTFQATTSKLLAQALQERLKTQNIVTRVYAPRAGGYLTFGIVPLGGILNWFGTGSVPFDLNIRTGLGLAKYVDVDGMLPSFRAALQPSVMVSNTLGFDFGVQYVLDRLPDSDWQNRIESTINVLTRF